MPPEEDPLYIAALLTDTIRVTVNNMMHLTMHVLGRSLT